MRNLRHPVSVTTASVAVTLLFYSSFNTFISPLISGMPGIGFLVSLFASVGFYLSLFHLLIWVYSKFLEERVNPKEAVTGEWFYKLEIAGKQDEPRYGICEISRHRGELCATGLHFNPTVGKFTSRFTSDLIVVDGNAVVILYTSVGVDEETFLRRGVYFLSTEGIPPRRIYGVWTDVLPSRNAGDIIMQRRDKSVEKLLVQIKYPKHLSEAEKMMRPSTNSA